MKKSKKNDAVALAEQHEKERRVAISEFNMNNMGKYWIDPDKVPTDEDIASAKQAFEDAVTEFQKGKDYVIADKANALRVATFLKNFIERSMWQQRMFVGVLNFKAHMDDFINTFNPDEPKDLVLDYMATQFTHIMLENYGGVGIESANWMAENWEEYLPIYETVHEHIESYNAEHKRCEELKEVWGMFEQGYYLVVLSGDDASTEVNE
jgi:hypothetical protein